MNASSSVFGKLFNRATESKKGATIFYNFLLMISVSLGWGLLYAFDFSFEVGVLRYSALFAICYCVCNTGIINALKHGPAALTSLLIGLSMVATAIWGFLFWDAEVTVTVIVGLVLVICAVALCLYTKQKDEKKFSWTWLFFVALAFFGNAGCAIVQRTQQMEYNGAHGNMLMLFATGVCALMYLFVYLKSDRSDSPTMLKTSWWAPVCAGLFNLLLNFFVMRMAQTTLSPSLIYPVIAVGRLAVVTVFSLFVFKEKMYPWQWLGVAVGTVATALLSM